MPKLTFDITPSTDVFLENETKKAYDKWFKNVAKRDGPKPTRASVARSIFEFGVKRMKK